MSRPLPDQSFIAQLLDYDPQTGQLTWKIDRRGVASANSPAGTVTPKGAVNVALDGRIYPAKKIIWKLMTGEDPSRYILSANRNPSDLRWDNLIYPSN